ncbi:hypothetical protein CLI64_17605 [Nostoc sp. CENA543]|uniref:DUF6745 domain-containing protein n=1 Tax=Nostoc sp. CENA543 TaxID=1869241 RepID=UPI000CA09654|nr:hypothetical protein [Nostoc sp. CENA543]AUT02054.1 hypothetical protein CLI64_17605 [Nostoc sp. CENA543]
MPQIQLLTPEQEAFIPEYQEKWRPIYLSTQPIDQIRAEASVKAVYTVMGQREPKVMFSTSPYAALQQLREIAQSNTNHSSQPSQTDPFLFIKAVWETFKLINQKRQAASQPIQKLHEQLSSAAHQHLIQEIERQIPNDLTTQDIVENSFVNSSPLIDSLGKRLDSQGNSDVSAAMREKQPEEWQESFQMTANNVDAQLSWLPAKKMLFRGWLKQMLQGTLTAKVHGVDHPQFQGAIFNTLAPSEQKIMFEHSPIIVTDLIINCIWLDFAFSVLNYPHDVRKWTALQNLVQNCGWILIVNDTCIVCDRPMQILLDENHQLHAENQPAVKFRDGFSIYAQHGTIQTH